MSLVLTILLQKKVDSLVLNVFVAFLMVLSLSEITVSLTSKFAALFIDLLAPT